MASTTYLIGSDGSVCLNKAGKSFIAEATEINPIIKYLVSFFKETRYLVKNIKMAKKIGFDEYSYRAEKVCWSVVRICTGIYPVISVQIALHQMYYNILNNYGWDEFASDLWVAAFVKMPLRFKPRKPGAKKAYTEYLPYFLRMFPFYVIDTIRKIKKNHFKYLPLEDDIAIELNDDYFDTKKIKEPTREELIDRLVTMNQCPHDPIQNMMYYLYDIGNAKASGYRGFGRVLGYKDLDQAGIKRTGLAVD